jgi:hypothetical protein
VPVIMSGDVHTADPFPSPESGVEEKAELAFDVFAVRGRARALTQITDAAFAEYGMDPGVIADMRHRFAQWRHELLAADRG